MANLANTIDRLAEFHSKHFPGSALPDKALGEFYEEEDEDDGLGYYEDGTKRTLTEEQIAIFRHSEIQDLIKRSVQARIEREEAAAEDEDVEMLNSADTVAEVSSQGKIAANVGAVAKGSQESSNQPSANSQKRKRKRGKKEESGKSQRRNPDDFKDEGKTKTYRRICRDMDTSKDGTVVLDY